MNWIRVASDMKSDPSVGLVAETCNIGIGSAVGFVVNVLGEMATQAKDGALGGVPDRTIELWAAWDGKRGSFAKAFRAALCTEEGVVRSWEKHNGAAIRKAENDIERKRISRAIGAETARGRRADGAATAQVDVDVDVNNQLRKQLAKVDIPSPPAATLRWVDPVGHEALGALFATVQVETAWVGLLRGLSQGTTLGRPVSAVRLALAVQDFVAAGKHLEPNGPNPKLFEGFVKRAKEPEVTLARQSDAEHKAQQLRELRERNEWCRRALRTETPEPAWAAQIDAMFPDGRTHPSGVAA